MHKRRKVDEKDHCDVCGKAHGPTYDFRHTLAAQGIKGSRATVHCIRSLHLTKKEED
jgi:hypothetical protein